VTIEKPWEIGICLFQQDILWNMVIEKSIPLKLWCDFNYPLVICYIAIENGPVEIVSFPINSMVDLSNIFQFAMLNYQRVSGIWDGNCD